MKSYQAYENSMKLKPESLNLIFGLFMFFLMAFSPLRAQETIMHFEKVAMPNHRVSIFSVVEDDDGFLWFGTFDGLYRYNGLSFTTFWSNPRDSTTLTHGRPLYVVKGHRNDLWIGTNTGGISRLDLNTYRFESMRHHVDEQHSLGGNNIGDIFVDNDSIIWIGSNPLCLNRVNWVDLSVTRYYPDIVDEDQSFTKNSNYLGQIVSDKRDSDVLWIGAPFGIYRFHKKTGQFELFRFATDQNAYKPTQISVYADNDGIVWAGSADGLIKIDAVTGEMQKIVLRQVEYPNDAPGGWRPSVIKGISDHELAIMTYYDGLIIFNKLTGAYTRMNHDLYLGRGSNIFLKDASGAIWIESDGALYRHMPDKTKLTAISLKHLPGINWSRSFLPVPQKNALYIGTLWGAGLLYADFDSREVKNFTYDFNVELNRDVYMADLAWGADSVIYIASDAGLLQFFPRRNAFSRITDKTGKSRWENITQVCVCGGMIWFSSALEGIFGVPVNSEEQIEYVVDNITVEVTDLLCHNNTLLAGTTTGLYKVLPETDQLQLLYPDIHISAMMIDSNRLLVSSQGQGLFRFNAEDLQLQEQYTSDVSSSINFIYSFTIDDNSVIWLNTDGGTVRFDMRIREYTTYLEMGIGRRSAIYRLPNGSVISGGYQRIWHFDPEDFAVRGIPPKPYITKIDIANHEETFSLAPDRMEAITLRPNEQELVIEFDAINFNTIPKTDFEYRIRGLTEAWKNIGQQRYLNINNPPGGEYLLEIRGKNVYGGVSNYNKTISIVVLPPVYARWWFQGILLLLVCSVIFLIFRYLRRRNVKKRFRDLEKYFSTARYTENSVDEILLDISRNVASRLDIEECSVYLFDPEHDQLTLKAVSEHPNLSPESNDEPASISLREGIAGRAVAEQQAIFQTKRSESEKGYRIYLAVPILHDDMAVGVIHCTHHPYRSFTKEHADTLIEVARICSHKIVAAIAVGELEARERNLLAVQKEIAELKLTALQAQMNPHFIFNSLNSINWYILKNKPAEASLYLTKFSKLVRQILDNSRKLTIPLDKELDVMKLYLELESMRFENTFDYEIQTGDEIDLEEVLVPPLILQPFVENAIWHGFMHKEEKGRLLIQIYQENGHLKCIVQDDGIGRRASMKMKDKEAHTYESKGIKLTTERIKLAHQTYLNEDAIRVIDLVGADGDAAGTRVEVLLPYD